MNFFQYNKQKPPRLLDGLLLIAILIVITLYIASWAILEHELNQTVKKRTSEYAHSITRIVTHSSADAILSEDKLQLNNLVKSAASDPYIISATLFKDDGRVLDKYSKKDISQQRSSETQELNTTNPETLNRLPVSSKDIRNNSNEDDSAKFEVNQLEKDNHKEITNPIKTQHKTYVEAINYQGVTVGWFKIILDTQSLESSLRKDLQTTQYFILALVLLSLFLLVFITLRYTNKIKTLIAYNHRFIQLNAKQLPSNIESWLDTIHDLSLKPVSKQQQEGLSNKNLWHSKENLSEQVFCSCEFIIDDQENSHTAENLSLATHYLKASSSVYGVQLQGDIFSGCLAAFLASDDFKKSYSDEFELSATKATKTCLITAISFIGLLKQLLDSLDLSITIRAFIGYGTISLLRNERTEITGYFLSNKVTSHISLLSPQMPPNELVSLGVEPAQLEPLGEFEPVNSDLDIPCYRLIRMTEDINQQVERQFRFIQKSSESESSL